MNQIAVIADNPNDRQLFKRLYSEHDFRFFAQGEFNQCESLCESCKNFKSIVIFHRRSRSVPVPSLPKSHKTTRVIVLSERTDESIVVDTLNKGANYYIDLHNTEAVLKARLDAALRCYLKRENSILNVDPYLFNFDSRTAYYENRAVNLSPREFELAYYLFSNRSRVVSNSELMTSVWTLPPSIDTRRIDTTICRIKKKMNLNTPESEWKVVRLRQHGFQIIPSAENYSNRG